MSAPLFVSLVLDGVGIGEQPDAHLYGDEGSDTLGHVCSEANPELPNLTSAGLGCIRELAGVRSVPNPIASFGRMQEVSAGKDSTTGHWELAGVKLEQPFPTYPQGFPQDLLEHFMAESGAQGILGNRAASGTTIVAELGEEHLETGFPIVYTSADSVFQIATHVDRVPLERLYKWCDASRKRVCVGQHAVGRVIARPFGGVPGSFSRISERRKDYSLPVPAPALPDVLRSAGIETISIGKIADLFAHRGFDRSIKTSSNREGVAALMRVLAEPRSRPTFAWANLVDFDQDFGHRNDTAGFADALEAFDRVLPDLVAALPSDARMFVTADHGNDPTTESTDHAREYVPVLYFEGGRGFGGGADRNAGTGRNIGTRATFADHAATVASYFGVSFACGGVAI